MMEGFLISLTLLFQMADSVITCNKLNSGTHYEWNPVLGDTCKSVVTRKSLIIGTSYLIFPKKYRNLLSISLTTSGAVGVFVTLK